MIISWDTELFKLIEETSITGRFMFCNLYVLVI
jgi:hypothetical protein